MTYTNKCARKKLFPRICTNLRPNALLQHPLGMLPTLEERCCSESDGVHEGALYLVEDNDSDKEEDDHETEGIGKHPPLMTARAQHAVLEELDEACDGIELHDKAKLGIGDGGQRIDDRRGILPKADKEGEKNLQVAILGGHGREEDAETKSRQGKHEHQQRHEESIPVGMDRGIGEDEIVEINDEEEGELDAETHEIADDVGQRHHQTGEIDLAEDRGIVHKGVACLGQAIGEIGPKADTGHIEKGLRHAIGGDFGDTSEDDHIHDGGHKRLHKEPKRSENGLLVLRDNIPLDKEHTQVAIAPELLIVHIKQTCPWFDFSCPFIHSGGKITKKL